MKFKKNESLIVDKIIIKIYSNSYYFLKHNTIIVLVPLFYQAHIYFQNQKCVMRETLIDFDQNRTLGESLAKPLRSARQSQKKHSLHF